MELYKHTSASLNVSWHHVAMTGCSNADFKQVDAQQTFGNKVYYLTFRRSSDLVWNNQIHGLSQSYAVWLLGLCLLLPNELQFS